MARRRSFLISDSKGLARFEAGQPRYSLVVRDIEEEPVPACAMKELGMVVWSPEARRGLAAAGSAPADE
ncbi:MAG: hypothetical protein ABSC95_17285 [Acetobacteraceae bacterium]